MFHNKTTLSFSNNFYHCFQENQALTVVTLSQNEKVEAKRKSGLRPLSPGLWLMRAAKKSPLNFPGLKNMLTLL
jgi:hypothetical protein